jgi:serine/threonine protein kinase
LSSPPTDPKELKAFQYRFFNEAQAAGKLAHPNIVYLYDACVEAERCYLVLEYVNGQNLTRYCQKANLLPIEMVVNIIYQCAKALNHAHKKDVIHRDIKPSNIMINEKGVAKITDFGIAAVEDIYSYGDQAGPGTSMYYASPEQMRQRILNHQTDIYSLGVVMYELLTGAKPFESDTDVGLFFKVTNEDPIHPKKKRPDLPDSLVRIVKKALERDLAERYRNGLQMAWELSANFDHLRYLRDWTEMEEKLHAYKKINFFRDFSPNELAEVSQVIQTVSFPDKAAIISEGAIEDCFYIVVSGKVRVSKNDRTIRILTNGDCFGEMAYMAKTARTADVEAIGQTELLRVNPTAIDQTSKDTQLRFFKVFSTTLVQRLIETNEILAKLINAPNDQ